MQHDLIHMNDLPAIHLYRRAVSDVYSDMGRREQPIWIDKASMVSVRGESSDCTEEVGAHEISMLRDIVTDDHGDAPMSFN